VYTWANKAGYDFFGMNVIGKEASDFFADKQDTYNKMAPLFNGDEKVTYVESWQRRCDGKKRLLGWWCRVLKDEEGNVTGALSTARDITERKMAEERVRASLREKEVLLQEVHHRVKNNLQIVYSLLGLQSDYIKNKQALEVFRESQNRIKSMALIHEKLYQSKNFAEIDLTDYVNSLTTNLFHTHHIKPNAIRMRTDIRNVYLGLETAIPCGLIINELVTNALKYAFPNGNKGFIRVGLRLGSDKKYTLIVSDNGVGLPENVDIHNTKTLGLQLVDSLVEQLEGSIEIDRKKGSSFKIRFGDLKYLDRMS